MRSKVCKIDNGTKDLEAILKESEKVAVYNELNHKDTLQLRLLCEEIDGMLPNIIDDFSGDFWIDFEDGVCKINLSLRFAEFSAKKKEELVAIAKNKKNSAEVGIVGMIRSALEDIFLQDDNIGGGNLSLESRDLITDYYDCMDYSYLWTLDRYSKQVKNDATEEWDELEKSVLASVADDIIVGVKGKRADIIIVKNFA